jgi:Single-stranded DNA-binding protein
MGIDTTIDPNQRRLLKIPALNVVHVCGTVVSAPHGLSAGERPAGALFDLSARTYDRGKKATTVRLSIVCWTTLAETVLARVHEGDVVLITGALQNHQSSRGSLQVTASVIQFLTTETTGSSQRE